MSKQHTPGPWRLGKKPEDGYIDINSDDHYALATVVRLMDTDEIAGRNSPDCEANAHLIAAAPEMLEALEWALPLARQYMEVIAGDRAKAGHTGLGTKRGSLYDHEVEAAEKACAAIAKAKGGAA